MGKYWTISFLERLVLQASGSPIISQVVQTAVSIGESWENEENLESRRS
jgi:hypothetical protein